MLEEGRGIRPNRTKAARWYRESAERGHPKAQLKMAMLYNQGLAFSKDPAEAMRWGGKAAEQGLPEAQYYMAMLYSQALGDTPDLTRVHMWLSLAAEAGVDDARVDLEKLEGTMREAQVTVAKRLAAEWRQGRPSRPKRE